MNLNHDLERLKEEEQISLEKTISIMDDSLIALDKLMKEFVAEAKNANIAINPDLYLSKLLAKKGKKDTAENRKKLLQSRDELYEVRLLLEDDYKGYKRVKESKVGLHACMIDGKLIVASWKMPVFRHYLLDNSSENYRCEVEGKNGKKYLTNYRLVVKNKIWLRFTRVVKAMSYFPADIDKETIGIIKKAHFFTDSFIDEVADLLYEQGIEPSMASDIIADEFLLELLERRTSQEFKNIVFSIQKKQGEIISAPYNKNMVVQGCAGSGKSMILMHRIPIILYDNPETLGKNNVYVITPSDMYIQLVDNMRSQLEISDIKMGTIENYYDYCISKYQGHSKSEYGKISYRKRIKKEDEEYVYSRQCLDDICLYYGSIAEADSVDIEKAYRTLNLKDNTTMGRNTYAQRINGRILRIQSVLNTNKTIIVKYYKAIMVSYNNMHMLGMKLRDRKSDILREITRAITKSKGEIEKNKAEISKLDTETNVTAIKNRSNLIDLENERLVKLKSQYIEVESDAEYFDSLSLLASKIQQLLDSFGEMKEEYSQNSVREIYEIVDRTGFLIGACHSIIWEVSKLEEKYSVYIEPFNVQIKKTQQSVMNLQDISDRYIEYELFSRLSEEKDKLSDISSNACKYAYHLVMEKIGIKPNKRGTISAVVCSPYIYLQTMYLYYGAPSGGKESLLAIDEAQGLAFEELRLLKEINDDRVTLNLYGDINQHMEDTKGIDDWSQFEKIIDYDLFELQENYRNASQITNYCNEAFGMNMVPINTSGRGVHKIKDEEEFYSELTQRITGTNRVGLSAIIVGDDVEAKYIISKFKAYEKHFHDMTDEEFAIHHTRWNIINICDAKGLEFNTVVVLDGRMSRNEKYVAYTRALDELIIYSEVVDNIDLVENNTNESETMSETVLNPKLKKSRIKKTENTKIIPEPIKKDYSDSKVKEFFKERGLVVIDQRANGGRLWVIGEKAQIGHIVKAAISKFHISGKYETSSEIKNKNGWCTKTEK